MNLTKPSDMIEGELGFFKGYKNNIDYSELIKINNKLLINDVSNKPWLHVDTAIQL